MYFSILLSKVKCRWCSTSSSNNMTYRSRRDHGNAPSNLIGKESHFFNIIFDKILHVRRLVRILMYLSPVDSRNLMLIKKHGLGWLGTSLILILLCIYDGHLGLV